MSIESEASEFKELTGRELPRSLIELYNQKGNGRFGPEYGLLGVISGHKTDLEDSMLSLYKRFCSDDPDDPNWVWPTELVPFIHIGCAIHYCIDTASSTNRVIEFDPTDYDPEIGPKDHFKKISVSFSEWVSSNV
ncbi:SMI1/KNR4 family protein [Microbulbifer sp. MLAF003]|uniref:SMI1/KNR4 family protein n=1 Tax=unclassified Microbulbifer TaxID=2619833 RepID=UPI0024AE7E9B|nr:SMI1/KNR4 family protein [Microbulbifer sp. MLAF003]WHI50486.1 SMI1/KNR4 family protein [Microbulbifer sp. MLAF003]